VSTNTDAPWKDEALLREKYHGEGLSARGVAQEFSCSKTTVLNWLDKHGIQKETPDAEKQYPWQDAELLESLYWDKGKSSIQIARELGCTKACVLKWMNKHEVERRKSTIEKPPTFYTTKAGYEKWTATIDGVSKEVSVHRLVAIAEYGFEAIDGKVVHHKNEVKWDNRPCNLEPMSRSEHNSTHSKHSEYPWRDASKLEEMLKHHSQNKLADLWDCNQSMISRWKRRHGL